MSSPFHIMAKPVCGTCNLQCQYCYYCDKPAELYPQEKSPRMTEPVLESFIRQYMQAQPLRCEIGWQGGEPLLAGREFYAKALELQGQFAQKGQTVANALQTNATLLDDAWCEFFAQHQFLIGVSMDGPQRVHDHYRKDHAGQPTWQRACAGMDLLAKHRVEFNILCTLNRVNAAAGADLYRFFVNRGIRYVQFIPVLERDDAGNIRDFSCTPEQLGRFLLDVFEQWASRDIGRVSERFIDSVLHMLVHGKATICCHDRQCGSAHVLEYNGDLYACDHFVYKQWLIGNIMERPLTELVQDARLGEFQKLKTELPRACANCEYLPYCNSGCPKHHVPFGTEGDRVNYFCAGYKMFFSHALDDLRKMAAHISAGQMPPLRRPGGLVGSAAVCPQDGSPAQPRSSIIASAPGRNDPCYCGSGRKFKNCCGR